MTTQTIALDLPTPLAQVLERMARNTYRSIEDLVVSTLRTQFLASPDLPPDIVAELNSMRFFSDEQLWAATKPSISPAELERLQQLHNISGRPLTPAEKQEQADLLRRYQLSALRRAQAFAVLAQRGYPIPSDEEMKTTV